MPWKIRNTVLTGKRPCLHMEDANVNVHLVTDLGNGVVDLYIGNVDPKLANVHITIDVDHDPVVELIRAEKCRTIQISVIESVLRTLRVDAEVADALMQKIRSARQKKRKRKPPVEHRALGRVPAASSGNRGLDVLLPKRGS